jgi:hypothetical protein
VTTMQTALAAARISFAVARAANDATTSPLGSALDLIECDLESGDIDNDFCGARLLFGDRFGRTFEVVVREVSVLDPNAWAMRHRECGPDCVVTGDRCEEA